ncbi:hypothetical protein BOVATA_033540 [Babesia ovata]|uniref:Uncharacterized protein n=1 Tax=Babesia ovata TaxID=189622 RepID=A0A2H6KFU1_9APIC|nr:uncharacterized protein BOVATA_033540 [Babesia ovata]GBE61861.1 hypothetical protein BOVATA_033540 [Babesia ovata]
MHDGDAYEHEYDRDEHEQVEAVLQPQPDQYVPLEHELQRALPLTVWQEGYHEAELRGNAADEERAEREGERVVREQLPLLEVLRVEQYAAEVEEVVEVGQRDDHEQQGADPRDGEIQVRRRLAAHKHVADEPPDEVILDVQVVHLRQHLGPPLAVGPLYVRHLVDLDDAVQHDENGANCPQHLAVTHHYAKLAELRFPQLALLPYIQQVRTLLPNVRLFLLGCPPYHQIGIPVPRPWASYHVRHVPVHLSENVPVNACDCPDCCSFLRHVRGAGLVICYFLHFVLYAVPRRTAPLHAVHVVARAEESCRLCLKLLIRTFLLAAFRYKARQWIILLQYFVPEMLYRHRGIGNAVVNLSGAQNILARDVYAIRHVYTRKPSENGDKCEAEAAHAQRVEYDTGRVSLGLQEQQLAQHGPG